ncbi:sporulation protein [Anaerobacillus sp. MEB173]|uniref:sporulation protein n=1 Tax=Anaerobacillus sp. MEB173 TaxID=3383345 RepID=UPI003F8E025F
MFERLFSSIGIGSTKVNTVLSQNVIERGKEVKGEVHLFGGNAEQKISEIYIHIDSEFHKFDDEMTDFTDITEPILEIKITDPMVIKPHENRVVPFSVTLPYYTPITFRQQKVQIQTELKINFFNHPVSTHDFLLKDQFVDDILHVLEGAGFKHSNESGLCRHTLPHDQNPTHCLQNFHLLNEQGTHIYFAGNQKDIDVFVCEQNDVQHYLIVRDEDAEQQLRNIPLTTTK